MENNNRRQFLKKSIMGITGAALLPSNLNIKGGFEANKSAIPEF
jgi:hypothetical protein